MERLTITSQRRDAVEVLGVVGELDLPATSILLDALGSDDGSTPGNIVLDLTDVTFIDSAGVAAILQMDRVLARTGRYLAIAAAQPQVVGVIQVTGLANHVPTVISVDAAVALLG